MNQIIKWVTTGLKSILPKTIRSWIQDRQRKRRKVMARQSFEKALQRSDIFLVGHPKSGNTWLAYMLGIILENDYEGKVTLANIGKYVPTIHAHDNKIDNYKHSRNPRIFRNEGPLYPEFYPKTIYLMRDPRAAMLSYYHHCVHDTRQNDWSIYDFMDEMLVHGCIRRLEPHLVRWDIQVLEWMDRANHQAVKVVKYEDLKKDCRQILRELLEFCEIPYDEDILSLAVERGNFQAMRKEEEKEGAESYPGEKGSRGFFVRKGEVDSWKQEMPQEVVKKIEKTFYQAMRRAGYLHDSHA